MIVAMFLLQADAAAAPAPVDANVQMSCTLASPAGSPIAADIDLKTKKPGTAALVAGDDTLLGHVGATSDAVAWPAGAPGAVAFVASAGSGASRYRVELVFAGDRAAGSARARVVSIGAPDGQPRVAQGFCGQRSGKRLAVKKLGRVDFDASVTPPGPPPRVSPPPAGLDKGSCRLVTPDRVVHPLDFAVTAASGNEATVAYRAADAQLLGQTTATTQGVRFHLVSPTGRVVAMTERLERPTPTYIATNFERSGVWIDVTRDRAVIAQGECGPAPLPILTPVQGQ